MTNTSCMVPKIWSATDIKFCHSEPFFALSPPCGPRKSKFWKNEEKKHLNILSFYKCVPQMRVIWCTITEIWSATDILDCFFSFIPPNNPKNQNFEKMKKQSGAIIILHKCTIKGNHMMYGSWDIKRDRQNCLSFWTIFCPFTLLTTLKIKILKKWKKPSGAIIILHKCTINDNHMRYGSWDIKHDRQNILSL